MKIYDNLHSSKISTSSEMKKIWMATQFYHFIAVIFLAYILHAKFSGKFKTGKIKTGKIGHEKWNSQQGIIYFHIQFIFTWSEI